MPFEQLSNDQALKIVRADFDSAANYRNQNHDWRWLIADALYTGWKQPKFWEGTKIPRAVVSVMVAFEQIESILPRVMQGLFPSPDWFEAVGYGKTTPAAARSVRDTIQAQLGDSNPRETVRRVSKSMLYYGNGIMMSGWNYEVRKALQYIPEFRPKTRRMLNPIDGVYQNMPAPGYHRTIREKVIEEYINQPFLRYVPLRRFYNDPNCPSPIVSEGRFCCLESYMYIDELAALSKCPGYESMPDLHTLWAMSQQNSMSQADSFMSDQEATRRANWMPWTSYSADPAAQRIRVILYFTKDRILWSLDNKAIVYNKPHPIGRLNFYDAFYADLLDRFYAMAITDVVEPEQRVQEGLLGARLDELSLSLHPTTVRKRGSGTPLYQLRVRPGGVAESDDPKNDIIRQYPDNATQNSHLEAQASQMRVQKATGASDMAVLGVGTSSNPAAKTATGAGLMGQAAASRIIYLVENICGTAIEPALQDIHDWNQRFLDPNQMIEAADGEEIDPILVFGAKVKFQMRAAAKMQSKAALLQLMPMTLQAMLNPQLQAQLNMMGMTVDFKEMMQMFMDASGYNKKFDWVRKMTKEEKEALAQKQPSKAETDMALQQDRMTRLKDMQLSKQEFELLMKFIDSRLSETQEEMDEPEGKSKRDKSSESNPRSSGQRYSIQ